jgi:aspartate/methionine/tyrosine aminotransferase
MHLDDYSHDQLTALEREASARYEAHKATGLALDLTRGKPSIAQLDLASALDETLRGDFHAADGTDVRGYGGIEGIAEARALGGELLGVAPQNVLAGGNSSLTFMYQYLMHAAFYGVTDDQAPWRDIADGALFLCPVPGYDRHFGICEDLGIGMVNVPMTGDGPDMDRVEALIAEDPRVRGMWCVPRYSNPSGETYSDETVRRIAKACKNAAPDFRLMWDDAYAVHTLGGEPAPLLNIVDVCRECGAGDNVVVFASTSKITFAGGGVAFLAASDTNLASFKKRLGVLTIGPDKVNQLRHVRFLKDLDGIRAHMQRHAESLKPKFDCVQSHLERALGSRGMGSWTTPDGGYFVSFYTRPGLAKSVVKLAAEAGVTLTPAGAAYPYGYDSDDMHIRLAPSYPELDAVDQAMQVFVTCVELATVRRRLSNA